ncbi:MAG: cytochrome P450 [Rhizobiaceae bacterium]
MDFQASGFSTRSKQVLEARDRHWCARTPFGLAVIRHREVGLLLRDKRLRQGSYAWPAINELNGSFADFWCRSVISTEGKTHRKLRNLAVPCLSPEFIESLKPDFDRISIALASKLRQGNRCEFMHDFSVPFAGRAICALLGLEDAHWDYLSSNASDLGLAMGLDCKSHEATFNSACDRLLVLASELIDRARRGDDKTAYVARLVNRAREMGDVTEQELLDMVVISIFGGIDTTRSQLGIAVALLATHQDQWRMLRRKPTLVPQAIEESIRERPTTTWATREAVEDFRFQGLKINKGDTLHMMVHASARDPAICSDPAFDITAKRKIHFGFGGGSHHCLGSSVARADIASALAALLRTFRSFSFDGEPEWLPDSGNTGPVRLPLEYHLV